MKPISSPTFEEQKRDCARLAVAALQPNQRIALGSGSTSEIFIRELASCPITPTLKLVATSQSSEKLAIHLGLHIFPLNSFDSLDISIDGADFVDPNGQLIKGFGGALTREKIAASLAKELWILIDASKLCQQLPLQRLPLEILPLALPLIQSSLHQMQITTQIRQTQNSPYITDNGGWILDIDASNWKDELDKLAHNLKEICGVIEHGLFLNFKPRLFTPQS